MAIESIESPATTQISVAGGASVIGSSGGGGAPTLKGKKRFQEEILKWIFGLCALVSVLTTFGIITVLFTESAPFFAKVPVLKFLTGREWTPLFDPANYGVLPLICGTFLVAAGAALFALPMGLMVAIYLSEYASPRARSILKPVLEVLAGIPTVVYGFFALIFITPVLQKILESSQPSVLSLARGNGKFWRSVAQAYDLSPLVGWLWKGLFVVLAFTLLIAILRMLPPLAKPLEPAAGWMSRIPKPVKKWFFGGATLLLLLNLFQTVAGSMYNIAIDPYAFPTVEVFNALSASIAIAIMTLPLVSSLCEDAIHVVPRTLREGSYALGATKMEVSTQVVIPAALSGIAASFILAISRAVGETMIVAIAAGSTPKMTINALESVQTMTGYIVQVALGDVPHGSIGYQTLFAVGLVLFAITVMMNLASITLVKKYRQKYD